MARANNGEMAVVDPSHFERIRCGTSDIIWLPSHVTIGENQLKERLHADEWVRAQTMKSTTRRAEYLRARYLVRELLNTGEPLPPSVHGAPSWPIGWVGSISHKDGHVAVAASQDPDLCGIGIDVESCVKVRLGLESRIIDHDESKILDAYEGVWERPTLLAMAFSFKESIFKCHFPSGQKMFYFHDAVIEDIDLGLGVLRARLKVDTSPMTPAGTMVEGHVVLRSENGSNFVLTTVNLRF
jgi:4'-phosphopantetheinyl transferase EntD